MDLIGTNWNWAVFISPLAGLFYIRGWNTTQSYRIPINIPIRIWAMKNGPWLFRVYVEDEIKQPSYIPG